MERGKRIEMNPVDGMGIVFPYTIGNHTFYTKQELVEWILYQIEKPLIIDVPDYKEIIIENPYHMEIHSKKDAEYAIKNMCSNCYRLHYCTGAEAYKCNKVKDEIRQHFIEKGE